MRRRSGREHRASSRDGPFEHKVLRFRRSPLVEDPPPPLEIPEKTRVPRWLRWVLAVIGLAAVAGIGTYRLASIGRIRVAPAPGRLRPRAAPWEAKGGDSFPTLDRYLPVMLSARATEDSTVTVLLHQARLGRRPKR